MAEQVYSALGVASHDAGTEVDVSLVYAATSSVNSARVDVSLVYATVTSFDTSFLGDIQLTSAYVSVASRCNGLDLNGNPLVLQEQWSEAMVYTDIIFPPCLSYGSSMTPTYRTDKVEVLSRAEQRNSRAEFPRFQYSISLENFDAPEIAEVLRIFHVCSGDHAAFLFMDPSDSTSKDGDAWVSETAISNSDQTIGIIVGGPTTVYPLYKTYTKGSRSKRRRIRHPKLDTLEIAVDGNAVTNWLWSEALQGVQFTVQSSPYSVTADITGNVITGADFSALNVNDMVTVTGFAFGGNNVTGISPPLRVVASDATSVTLQHYDGTVYGAGDETGVSIVLTQVPPPASGVITAGFYFYTPVRFDGDQVNFQPRAGLRETFQGELSLSLIEVFE